MRFIRGFNANGHVAVAGVQILTCVVTANIKGPPAMVGPYPSPTRVVPVIIVIRHTEAEGEKAVVESVVEEVVVEMVVVPTPGSTSAGHRRCHHCATSADHRRGDHWARTHHRGSHRSTHSGTTTPTADVTCAPTTTAGKTYVTTAAKTAAATTAVAATSTAATAGPASHS